MRIPAEGGADGRVPPLERKHGGTSLGRLRSCNGHTLACSADTKNTQARRSSWGACQSSGCRLIQLLESAQSLSFTSTVAVGNCRLCMKVSLVHLQASRSIQRLRTRPSAIKMRKTFGQFPPVPDLVQLLSEIHATWRWVIVIRFVIPGGLFRAVQRRLLS